MRLDLFLKKTRLVRQRTLAKQLCDASRVSVNARPAKAGQGVRPGDRIRLQLPHRDLEVRVLALPGANVARTDVREFYQVVRERVEPVLEALEDTLEGDDPEP
jgi:ribosomal 50S subunit-recycling heat shock protein